jgi:hypothetical protein
MRVNSRETDSAETDSISATGATTDDENDDDGDGGSDDGAANVCCRFEGCDALNQHLKLTFAYSDLIDLRNRLLPS